MLIYLFLAGAFTFGFVLCAVLNNSADGRIYNAGFLAGRGVGCKCNDDYYAKDSIDEGAI